MKIIPALDILDGKCVRLTKGDYSTQKTYNENPLEVAKEFEANGLKYLHLVDLDGAKSSHVVNYKVLEKIISNTNLIVDFGGGIKSNEDIRIVFESGATQVSVGSIAVKNETLFISWVQHYGSEKIILGADCKDRLLATQGWLETSRIEIIDFLKRYEKNGVKNTICTDISKDGMLNGPACDLYKDILKETKLHLIASGGIANLADIIALKEIGCTGAIVGKAIYEGKITLKELAELC